MEEDQPHWLQVHKLEGYFMASRGYDRWDSLFVSTPSNLSLIATENHLDQAVYAM